MQAAVVHQHFQRGSEVDVHAAGGVGIAVGHTGFGTARNGIVQRLVDRAALDGVQGHHFLVVDELREPGAILNGQGDLIQETVGRARMDADREVGVGHREFALGLEEQIGQLVGGVLSLGRLAADGDGFPVGIAFLEFIARGVDVQVDELGHVDPHAFEQFLGFLGGQRAFFNILLVVRIEVLVHAAVGNDGAGLLFDAREHLHEPLALDGFAEVAGRISGHMLANVGHAEQFLLADRIGRCGGGVAGKLRMALRPDHDGVAHDDHGFEERLLFPDIHGIGQVEARQLGLGFVLNVDEAALHGLFIVRDPLERGTVGRGFAHHELGLQAAFVVIGHAADFGGQHLVEVLMVGLAFPVGGDFFHEDLHVGGIDLEGALFAVGKILHDFNVEVAVDFRIQDAVASELPYAAREKLVGRDVYGNLFSHILERLGPAQGQQLTFGLAHGFREIPGALDVHVGNGELDAVENLIDAFAALAVDFLGTLKTFFLRGQAAALGHGEPPNKMFILTVRFFIKWLPRLKHHACHHAYPT